jgi:hypothetical protein
MGGAATALVTAIVLVGTSALARPAHPSIAVTSGTDFSITSTVTASPGCATAALLYPGTAQCLTYTVHNSLNVPITVSSLSIPSVTAPATCPVSNLDLTATTFSGSLIVPAMGTNTASVPISLKDTPANQNICEGASFDFTYSGSATYSQAYVTTTTLASSQNPSNVGQSVTYTAMISARAGTGQDPPPNSPTGTVSFKDGSTTICTANIPVSSASSTTSTGNCSSPAYFAPMTHLITAIFTSNDTTEFSNSTSPVWTQTVIGNRPSRCTGSYANTIVGSPSNTTVDGTNESDLITAFGANFKVGGEQGNDCLNAGDGNNSLTDGDGADTVVAGNGTNTIVAGNGNDTVVVGNGNGNHIVLGNGDSASTLGTGSDNSVTMGSQTFFGSMGGSPLNKPIVGMAATSDARGYWLVASDGGTFAFGDAAFFGSMGGTRLSKPIVGMAPTPDSNGYWLVASDGGIFAFGDAAFFGSMGGRPLNGQMAGMAATPDGRGYWLVSSVGGIFTFGDAGYFGSIGHQHLNKPILGMATTPDGKGYWLVASDGGIFTFGNASFYGSMGGAHLNKPVKGMAATADGKGYWEIASDGGIFSFGDAPFAGSMGGTVLNKPIVGIAHDRASRGYWEVASDGGIFSFGSAADTVTVQGSGSHDTVNGWVGNETIYFGSGTYNTYVGGTGRNICHVPSPGALALHDTLINCSEVSP